MWITFPNSFAGGDSKPLYFFDAFKSGFLHEFQHKILYIHLRTIPQEFILDGWKAEAFLRNQLSQNALARIKGLEKDDLFLSFDADEIPKREVKWIICVNDGLANLCFECHSAGRPIPEIARWILGSFAIQYALVSLPLLLGPHWKRPNNESK